MTAPLPMREPEYYGDRRSIGVLLHLKADSKAAANFGLAQKKRFIFSKERTFLRRVCEHFRSTNPLNDD